MCESFRGRECQDFVLGGRVAVTLQVDTTSPRNACCSGQSASGPWVASPVGTWCPASPRPCLPRAASSLICGCRGSRRHLLGPKGLSFFEESFLKVVSWRFRGSVSRGRSRELGLSSVFRTRVASVAGHLSVRRGHPEPRGAAWAVGSRSGGEGLLRTEPALRPALWPESFRQPWGHRIPNAMAGARGQRHMRPETTASPSPRHRAAGRTEAGQAREALPALRRGARGTQGPVAVPGARPLSARGPQPGSSCPGR